VPGNHQYAAFKEIVVLKKVMAGALGRICFLLPISGNAGKLTKALAYSDAIKSALL
jgi:hypothetical protein